jgi:pyridoxine 5-phosphate synthase
MAKLSVNLNKVATLRNTRPIGIPSVVHAARLCLDAGAAGITVHPRPDQRHIRPGDVDDLAALLRGEYPAAEFNIEGNPFHAYMEIVRKVRPAQATLVPDAVAQSTSDHGWNLRTSANELRPIVKELRDLGCRVSLFVDAESAADYAVAAEIGAQRVELYTEPYARDVAAGRSVNEAIAPYVTAAATAVGVGLQVNAGHDLNLRNLPPFVAAIPSVAEVSIGHALIADALEFSLPETVRRYIAAATGVRVED